MKTPKGDWKANQFDWDRISGLSDEECCFSLTQKEVAIILTYTEMIGWVRRWFSETDATVNLDDIDRWKSGLERKLMSGCCPDDDAIHQYLPDGTYQTSTDGGVTWVDDPEGDPRSKAIIAPPLPGADSDAKRCAAADNVRDQYKVMRDQCISLLTAGTYALAIVAGIIGLIAGLLLISVVSATFGVLLFGLAAALLALTPEEVAEQIDDTALDVFRCIIYCHMDNSGRVAVGAFDNILSQIAEQFDGFQETFFYSITASLTAAGINNAATIGAATAEDCDCSCPTECPERFEAFVISGIPRATDIVYGDGFIEFTAYDDFGYIASNVSGDCCYMMGWELVSGAFGSITGHVACGGSFPGGLVSGDGFNTCVQILEAHGAVNARYKVYFGGCP